MKCRERKGQEENEFGERYFGAAWLCVTAFVRWLHEFVRGCSGFAHKMSLSRTKNGK